MEAKTERTSEVSDLWHAALAVVREQVPEPSFRTWLLNAQLREVVLESTGKMKAVLAVPSAFAAEWLRGHYESIIANALLRCSGMQTHVAFVVEKPAIHRNIRALDGILVSDVTLPAKAAPAKEELPQIALRPAGAYATSATSAASVSTLNATQPASQVVGARSRSPHNVCEQTRPPGRADSWADHSLYPARPLQPLNPLCTFDCTVVGRVNQCAVSLGHRICREDGTAGNPLFIYGPHGAGKSHLLHAVGNESCRRGRPRVALVPATVFESAEDVDRLVQFHTRQQFEMLLIDDLQHIASAGGRNAQQRLAELIENMLAAGSGIAITAMKPPGAMMALNGKLLSCLSNANIVSIGLPDLEMKSKLVATLMERSRITLHRHALQMLASTGSDFSGLVYLCEHLISYQNPSAGYPSQNQGGMLTAQSVQAFLDEMGSRITPGQEIAPERIIYQTASYFDLEIKEICSSSREEKILLARQIGMYLIRELTDRSYKWIAQRFARQDHTTAMNSCARIDQLAKSNSDVRQALLELRQMIFGEQEEQDRTASDVALF